MILHSVVYHDSKARDPRNGRKLQGLTGQTGHNEFDFSSKDETESKTEITKTVRI